MKILLTGGAGYIGSNLAEQIDRETIIYDVRNDSRDNILDYYRLSEKLDGYDICYHLAALSGEQECECNPRKAVRTNIEGTFNVLKACQKRQVKPVFISSIAAVSRVNVYGATKRTGELLSMEQGAIICRLSNVYGGRNYLEEKNTVIARFTQDNPIVIHGTGEQTRDFIHIDDVTSALLHAPYQSPGLYNVCTGQQTSIKQLASIIKNLRKDSPQITYKTRKTVNLPNLDPDFPAKTSLKEGVQKLLQTQVE